ARQAAVVRAYGVFTQALGQIEGHAFRKPARVHKDQRGAMLLHELADAVVNLVPEVVAGDRSQLLPRDLDGQIHRALVAHVHTYRVWSCAAREEVRTRFNRFLRGGEADARWTRAGERAIEHVEPFE